MCLKKAYPSPEQMLAQGQAVASTVIVLALAEVEILRVEFRPAGAVIEARHCPGTDRLGGEIVGHGVDDQGRFIRKRVVIEGCFVIWSELV